MNFIFGFIVNMLILAVLLTAYLGWLYFRNEGKSE